jgi:hypothetical protein
MKKLFDNPKPVVFVIVALILLFSAYKANATEIEFGPTYTGSFNGGVSLSLIERVLDDKLDIGLSLIGEQESKGLTIPNNGTFWVAFVASKPKNWWAVLPSEVHIGGAYWINEQKYLIGSRQTFLLGVKWRILDNWSVGIRHWSNAGTTELNQGQDVLTFGYRF